MQSQVFQNADFGEDRTVQLLAVEQNLVEHGHGDGVRTGESFFGNAGVATIDVVNLDVGRSDKGVVDDTLIRVSELQVVGGSGV